jgi:hypothetical protein
VNDELMVFCAGHVVVDVCASGLGLFGGRGALVFTRRNELTLQILLSEVSDLQLFFFVQFLLVVLAIYKSLRFHLIATQLLQFMFFWR